MLGSVFLLILIPPRVRAGGGALAQSILRLPETSIHLEAEYISDTHRRDR
jgi:hypothetical protein